jgi:hypothetical protein
MPVLKGWKDYACSKLFHRRLLTFHFVVFLSVAPLLQCSVAMLLCCDVAVLFYSSCAMLLCCSVAPFLCLGSKNKHGVQRGLGGHLCGCGQRCLWVGRRLSVHRRSCSDKLEHRKRSVSTEVLFVPVLLLPWQRCLRKSLPTHQRIACYPTPHHPTSHQPTPHHLTSHHPTSRYLRHYVALSSNLPRYTISLP